MRVERLAKKPNQTIRKTRINNPMKFPFTLFLLSLLALSPVNASERPNVLLIVCDDLNTRVSTSGYSPIQTLNFDRLTAVKLTYRMNGDSFVLSGASTSRKMTDR